jgi:hypothetical protein
MEEPEKKERKRLSKKLDAIGWSLLFIWIGLVLITGFETGVMLLGIGLIILGGQAGRKYFQLKVEKFWLIVGLLFLGGGLWGISGLNAPFAAVVLILAGVLILFSTLRKQDSKKTDDEDIPDESTKET